MFRQLNQLSEAEFKRTLESCCAARRWLSGLAARRPFADDPSIVRSAAEVWWALDASDWREAFAAHPRIGDLKSLQVKYANTRDWASSEQATTHSASQETLQQLARANAEYEARFGYLFIICATGKSPQEMLAHLKQRLGNEAAAEIHTAATEQLKITQLRLKKLGS